MKGMRYTSQAPWTLRHLFWRAMWELSLVPLYVARPFYAVNEWAFGKYMRAAETAWETRP